jgi:hypothetical protein
MTEANTTAVVQQYLDALAGDSPADTLAESSCRQSTAT